MISDLPADLDDLMVDATQYNPPGELPDLNNAGFELA